MHVDLPEVGTEFSHSDAIIAVESVKTAADVYQMCGGEVIEINEDVAADAALVNEDAEGNGWLMKVRITDAAQLGDLLDQDAYKSSL